MNFIRQIKNIIEFTQFLILKGILPKVETQENSLLLINTGLIGDLIVSSILLENQSIFKKFDKIHFLIKDNYLELFDDYSGRVKIIGYNYAKYKFSLNYKHKTLSNLRSEGFETSINLTAARGILNEEMTHLVGSKRIITLNIFLKYLGNGIGKYFDKRYTKIIAKNVLNEYEKHIELISYLREDDKEQINFNLGNLFANKNKVNLKYQSLKDYIVIAPFSSVMNRDWNKEHFKELINILKTNNNIVLLGSKDQFTNLKELSSDDKNIVIIAGKLKLNELPSIIEKGKLFIGLDSGLTHIALKVGVPIVAIIGGGEFGRFFPYKESQKVRYLYSDMDCFLCHWECTKKEKYCITEVSLEDVLREVNSIID